MYYTVLTTTPRLRSTRKLPTSHKASMDLGQITRKKLLFLSILFSFSTALSSWERPKGVSESYLQVINDGRDAVEALYGRTPMPENLETKNYSNAELVLDNDYISQIIQPHLSDEMPKEEIKKQDDTWFRLKYPEYDRGSFSEDFTENEKKRKIYEFEMTIPYEQKHCRNTIVEHDYFAFIESIEMLKLYSARFSNNAKNQNYIANFTQDIVGDNFLHYASLRHWMDKYSPEESKYNHEIRCLMIEILHNNNVNINAKTCSGYTPAHYAAGINSAGEASHPNIIKKLHSLGADLNVQDWEGNTPLHIAVLNKHLSIIKALLLLKVDTTLKTKKGLTAEQMTNDPEFLALFVADRADNERIQENRADVIKQLKFKLKYCLCKRKIY